MKNHYAGIGSRSTPFEVMRTISRLAGYLASRDWILRSGGADGADAAFEAGVPTPYKTRGGNVPKTMKQIFLPWESFNGNASNRFKVSKEALEIASHHHPNWAACDRAARLLHGRNVLQVLGPRLDNPSKCVICWTPGGKGGGGTGQAIRIAIAHSIPVFDLAIYGADYVQSQVVALEKAG